MIDHIIRVLFKTREGLIVVGASAIYLAIGLMAKFNPSIAHIFGFIGFMAFYMPIVMFLILFKAGGHRQGFQSSWLTTIILIICALIPVLLVAKGAISP